MDDLKIILFLCNWGPHAAFQTLQDLRADIPAEVRMVRIPCSGRITRALLFKPFEMGADGVALMGCRSGSCRYGSGTETALENTEDTRRILRLMGLGEERLRLGSFHPDESASMLSFLQQFVEKIRQMGKSPVIPGPFHGKTEGPADSPEAIAAAHDIIACQDCGKCTSACPLALAGKPFSPRALAGDVVSGRAGNPEVRQAVDSCLTCGICYERCPSAINFPEFIKDMRGYYRSRGLTETPAHGGFFQSMMRAMASHRLFPRRWEDLPQGIRTRPESEILFFGGCAPYFDIFFQKFLHVETGRILEDSLRLLNFFDVEPAVLENERCCGHDLLWSGDRQSFVRLAQLNARAIAATGAKQLITACPECHHTLSQEYPRHGVALGVEVTHIHAYLEKEIDKGAVGFKPLEGSVTFHDACRQSRFQDQADLPRRLVRRVAGTGFRELPDSGAGCCGNSAWIGCDAFSKAMQVKRLTRARETGCDLMLTACPKCQIHLRCAMEDPLRGEALKMDLMDLTSAIANTIYWE